MHNICINLCELVCCNTVAGSAKVLVPLRIPPPAVHRRHSDVFVRLATMHFPFIAHAHARLP